MMSIPLIPAHRMLCPLLCLSLALGMSTPTIAAAPAQSAGHDITGTWRTIDDQTGYAKSLIRITPENGNNYGGTIVQILTHPGYTPKTTCQNCPDPYTSKPIEGLHVLTGLHADPANANQYSGGHILDPLSGHIYSAKATLAPNGKTLTIRGFIGFSMLGRSQTWTRVP